MEYTKTFLINFYTLSNQNDFPDENIKSVYLIEYVKTFYINALKNIYNNIFNSDELLEDIIKFVSLNNLLKFSLPIL